MTPGKILDLELNVKLVNTYYEALPYPQRAQWATEFGRGYSESVVGLLFGQLFQTEEV